MNAPPQRESWWRLWLALLAFVLWAHPSLVGLPFAALRLLVPGSDERRGWSQPLGGLIGAMSATLLALTAQSGGRLAAVTSAYIVLVTAAFIALVLLKPVAILRQAMRAMALGGLVSAVLIQLVWGPGAWGALAWEVTRVAGLTMRSIVEYSPDQVVQNAFAIYEPMVRFVSLTWPAMLVLQTLAGLALAWHLHLRLTPAGDPAGAIVAAPPGRFKDFRMGDGWVWGIVAWLAVLILPVSNLLHIAGTNVGLVAGVLYVLRGAAIVATFAEAFGVSAVALVLIAGIAATLAVPLLFVLPGLCTLGITDTWYQYRRRLAAARSAGPTQPKD